MTELQTTVAEAIKAILTDTSLSDDFIEMVLLRLESLGYTVVEGDAWPIAFAIQKGENHYKNFCHFSVVPEALYNNLCDEVCGEFLKTKYATGGLDETTVASVAKAITMGDTRVEFNTENEYSFISLLDDLINSKVGDLICYRSIKW